MWETPSEPTRRIYKETREQMRLKHKSNLPCPSGIKRDGTRGLNMEELFNSRYYFLPMYLLPVLSAVDIICIFIVINYYLFKQIPKKNKEFSTKIMKNCEAQRKKKKKKIWKFNWQLTPSSACIHQQTLIATKLVMAIGKISFTFTDFPYSCSISGIVFASDFPFLSTSSLFSL